MQASRLVLAGAMASVSLPARAEPVRLSGYLQADAVAWSQESVDEVSPSSGESLNQERVLIRRGRLRADADHGLVSGSLELDGNTVDGATARIVSAEATVGWPVKARPPLVAASLGLMKIPFGAEVPLRDRDRPFLETSNAGRALFPGNYDAGARVFGGWRFLHYSLAAMNGAPPGEAQFRGGIRSRAATSSAGSGSISRSPRAHAWWPAPRG